MCPAGLVLELIRKTPDHPPPACACNHPRLVIRDAVQKRACLLGQMVDASKWARSSFTNEPAIQVRLADKGAEVIPRASGSRRMIEGCTGWLRGSRCGSHAGDQAARYSTPSMRPPRHGLQPAVRWRQQGANVSRLRHRTTAPAGDRGLHRPGDRLVLTCPTGEHNHRTGAGRRRALRRVRSSGPGCRFFTNWAPARSESSPNRWEPVGKTEGGLHSRWPCNAEFQANGCGHFSMFRRFWLQASAGNRPGRAGRRCVALRSSTKIRAVRPADNCLAPAAVGPVGPVPNWRRGPGIGCSAIEDALLAKRFHRPRLIDAVVGAVSVAFQVVGGEGGPRAICERSVGVDSGTCSLHHQPSGTAAPGSGTRSSIRGGAATLPHPRTDRARSAGGGDQVGPVSCMVAVSRIQGVARLNSQATESPHKTGACCA